MSEAAGLAICSKAPLSGDQNMLDDAVPQIVPSVLPPDHTDPVVETSAGAVLQFPANENAPAPPETKIPEVMCSLDVGGRDERGNTVKYIYSCDRDYVVYYSRLEHKSASADAQEQAYSARPRRLMRFRAFSAKRATDLPYESEGVQAQLTPDPDKRKTLRQLLLPLGTERAKLQALLSGWPRRQSFDSSVAIALQLALGGAGNADANANALQTLKDTKAAILNEREIAGKAQYVRFTLILGLFGVFLLMLAQHNMFKGSGNFWLGAQAGLLGAVLSIAIGIRNRTVALDIGFAGNLSESALRLVIGTLCGGTLVLLFSTGLLPSLHTLKGEQDAVQSMPFVLLLGIIAGFVEQLVPSLLDDQANKFRNGDVKTPPPTAAPGDNKPA
jgi:hypothetical protein